MTVEPGGRVFILSQTEYRLDLGIELEDRIGTYATLAGAKDRGLKLATEWRTKQDKQAHPAKDNPWVHLPDILMPDGTTTYESVIWELRLAEHEKLTIVREELQP